jgi:hypothetical protein
MRKSGGLAWPPSGPNLAQAGAPGDFSQPGSPRWGWKAMSKEPLTNTPERVYPRNWENVAHLRIFRTSTGEWDKVVGWRADMIKRGWRLLRVSSDDNEIVAVFGKTKIGQGS